MKTTILEYGFVLLAVILAASFLAGFNELIEEGGNIKEIILDFVNDIC